MENKCTCLNPSVNCFSGQCSYCNKQISKNIYAQDLNPNKIIGTFCNKCRNIICNCISNISKANKMETIPKHGGKRKGAGAKPKYNEPTQQVTFRCPTSKVKIIKALIAEKLNEWKIK